MNVCANCDSAAIYIYEPVANVRTLFCGKHLPGFIRRSGIAKTLELVPEFDAALEQATKAVAKNSPKTSTKVTIDKSEVVEEEVELDSTEIETTEEEVTDEREPGLD